MLVWSVKKRKGPYQDMLTAGFVGWLYLKTKHFVVINAEMNIKI